MLLVLITGAGMTVMQSAPARAQVGPEDFSFEIDADYGDWLQDLYQNDGGGYLPALDVNVPGGAHTWGRRQTPCDNWTHTTVAPYMGPQSYRSHCQGVGPQRRTEQMVLSGWLPDASDSQRYFSLAFRLVNVPQSPPAGTRGYVAQLHQGSTVPPPFRMQWEYLCPPDSAECGYYLTMGVRWGTNDQDDVFQEFGPPIGGGRSGIALSHDSWYRMLFRISLIPDLVHAPCPGTGEVQAWLMDESTGRWIEVGYYNGRLGFTTPTCDFQWKVGIYANNQDLVTVDYDNVAYGKRWNNITKNRLVGYSKTVLDFWCNEGSGTVVNDRSYWRNGGQAGDPGSDYDNDGAIVGSPLWNADGIHNGGSLRFNGSNYVAVPMDDVDFDFGNYCTASCWFRTTNHPVNNKGLLFIDEFSSNYKLRLYMSDTNLSFGVRYTDGSTASLNYGFPAGRYADGRWHHALATFNRFAPDGQRLKLYVDGEKVLQIAGSDLPMLRGEDRLVLGKYSTSEFFVGDIDEVLVRNYAMTEEEVRELFVEYLPASGMDELDTASKPATVTVLPNPGGSEFTIRFAVPRSARTTLTIVDPTGRAVALPFDDEVDAGEYEARWDGRNRDGVPQPSGVYYFRLECDGRTDTGQMVLLR
jgi:hypothetical protein